MKIYQEIEAENGIMRGFLERPECEEKIPLVVMYHGFTGHKGENKFLFSQFSRYLCNNNIASLRFDFLGSGESDNEFNYMTFSNEVDEAKLILDYALTLPFVSELIVMGFSMGGAIATQIAKERGNDFQKLLLWSPAGNMHEIVNFQSHHYGDKGYIDLGGIGLNPDFVSDILSIDLWKDIEVFTKPVSLHQGNKDGAVPLYVSEKYQQKYPNIKVSVYEEADHTFTNVIIRKELFNNCLNFLLEKK